MNPFAWALYSLRQKGAVQTTKIACNVAIDLAFDWRYGTDTLRWVDESDLEANSSNQSHSAPYRATKAQPFLRLLHQLDLPRQSAFVDIGSGKGRVVLIASRYGFQKVVGIEFSHKLCVVARQNVELFSKRTRLGSPIEIVEGDATTYRFDADQRVLFMYNPFDGHVMKAVVANIRRSLEEHPRQLWLIYNTPQEHEVIKRSGVFASDSFYEIGGNHFRVYTN